MLKAMEPPVPRPMNSQCNSVLDRARERTTTGKRSRHTCCLEPADSIHISIAGFCLSATVVLGIPPATCPVNTQSLQSSSPVKAAKIPRLRQRMRCRREPSHSARRYSPSFSSSPSDTSAPSGSLPRLFRGRLLRSGRRLDSPSGDALPAQSHTALFSFDCALNRPRVTVAISVVFLEEPLPENPPEEQAPVDGAHMDTVQQDTRGQPEVTRASLQDDSVRVQATVTESPTAVHHNVEFSHAQSAPEDFGCRIEEIAPDE